MRWLVVTLVLLVAAAALIGAIYERDRRPGADRPSTPTTALADAEVVLGDVAGWHCARCAVTHLRPVHSGMWWARLRIRSQSRCVRIDLKRFSLSPERGLTGTEFLACR